MLQLRYWGVEEMRQVRLFWAVNLPDGLKRRLFGIQSRLRVLPADIKWVEQQNLHLTVKFLGDVEVERISEIARAGGDAVAATGTFALELAGIGFFPGPQKPRVIWVGVHDREQKFRHLHDKVEESMSTLGFVTESKKFSPHLTLGRVRSLKNGSELVHLARETAREFGAIGTFTVDSVVLMQSKLTRKGPIYAETAVCRLN